MRGDKYGQVWVETVVYTLIAFALIGAVLGFARPKIEELQDRALIEQSVSVLEDLDSLLNSIKGTSGNVRIVEILVKKGFIKIDGVSEQIVFEIESRAQYSEPGVRIEQNGIIILTESLGELNRVTLSRDYSSEFNLTYNGNQEIKLINKAPSPHEVSIENAGSIGNLTAIDIRIL